MKSFVTHRKCFACGTTTSELSKDKCKCGAYMHMVGQVYTPKVVFKEKRAVVH